MKKLLIAFTAFLSLLMVCPAFAPSDSTHDANSMWVDPEEIDVSGQSIGYRFNVTVWLNVSVDCSGWQFKMIFDKSLLNATRAGYTGTGGTRSQFFENSGTQSLMPLTPTLNAPHNGTHNYVLHGEAWSPMVPDNPYATGAGSLSWVEFEVIAEPPEGGEIVTKLDISTEHHPPTSKTYALDENDKEISLNVYDCVYTAKSLVVPPPPPPPGVAVISVYPEEIIDPTMLPSSIFSINITVDDVGYLQVCEFNLSYNSAIISWVSTRALKVQNQIPSVTSMIDNEAGFIWMRLRYSTAFSTDIPTPILTIEFHVNAFGATPLDLHDTSLLNSEGQPIEHQVMDGFFSTLIRDVAIVSIQLERNWTYQGRPVNMIVTFKNEGNVAETFNVSIYYDDSLIEKVKIDNLTPDEQRTISVQWDTTGVPEGNYTIRAEAETVPYELDVEDNVLVDGTIWIMTTIHDISIVNVDSPAMAYQGWQVKINVTVKNKGNSSETFEVKLYFDNHLIDMAVVTDLYPDEVEAVVFDLDTADVTPCTNYTISAEVPPLPYELDTMDNSFIGGEIKIRFMGDVNGDGFVDIKDILMVGDGYGAHPGSPRWNPELDLDQNNFIDIKDVLKVAKNYGKGC